jgi:diguanylate cyclase (GGDEF)-like protein/PAS domain S-box-containing protein
MFMHQEEENILNERQEHLQRQYQASILTYQRLTQFAFAQHFNNTNILNIMGEAGTAGPVKRGVLRQQLYDAMQQEYTHLRTAGFRQIHFHLNDGTSFLRLHSPKMYGDQLQIIRPSIARMMQEKKPLQGYEIGRQWVAYRFIFPLWHDGRFLGSVELSLPFSVLLANLRDSFPTQARLVISRHEAAVHLDPGFLQSNYQASVLGPEFLEEVQGKQSTPSRINDKNVPIEDSILNYTSQGLAQYASNIREAFSVSRRVGGQTILVSLLPIKNIGGHQTAILIFDEEFHYLNILRHRYVVGWLIVTAFSLLLLTLHRRYTRDMEASHAELDQIFNTAADGIRVMDKKGIIIRANNTFAELVGLPLEEIIGHQCYSILAGDSCRTEHCPMVQIAKGKKIVREEADKELPNGRHISCMVVASPFSDCDGKQIGIIEDFRDISERKKMEQQLRDMAVTDELTGLYNRRGFMGMASQQLQCIKRSNCLAVLLFADLDNMKTINDTLGHKAGDLALQATAEMLRSVVRKADIVSRMGGDEFAALMSTNPKEASEEAILKRLNMELARINRKRPRDEQISISFGLVCATKETTLEQLLSMADAKMYAVKEKRRVERKMAES